LWSRRRPRGQTEAGASDSLRCLRFNPLALAIVKLRRHGEPPTLEVEVAPHEAEQLGGAWACVGAQPEHQARALGRGPEQPPELAVVQHARFLLVGLRLLLSMSIEICRSLVIEECWSRDGLQPPLALGPHLLSGLESISQPPRLGARRQTSDRVPRGSWESSGP
jgi:hypothetical protein